MDVVSADHDQKEKRQDQKVGLPDGSRRLGARTERRTRHRSCRFGGGREISRTGTKDLPLGPESITGFTIVNAASLDDAGKMAQGNPFISSIRIYEIRSH